LCRGTALGFCQARCFLGVTTRTDRQVWPSYDHAYPISAACFLPMETFHACSSALSVVARGADWLVWERLHLLDAWAPTKGRKDENCSRSLALRKCSHAVCKTTAGLQKTRKRHRSPNRRKWRFALHEESPESPGPTQAPAWIVAGSHASGEGLS
jgi:hypothetical protein